ncbi:uncharacterized protein [Diadema antillarum]|uniref:uncharacterized protein n=1 Tax=Diadema antillarum TaxID=105358 RepID=UPI003A884D90
MEAQQLQQLHHPAKPGAAERINVVCEERSSPTDKNVMPKKKLVKSDMGSSTNMAGKVPQSKWGQKTAEKSSDVEDRLSRLESLLSKVVDALPSANSMPKPASRHFVTYDEAHSARQCEIPMETDFQRCREPHVRLHAHDTGEANREKGEFASDAADVVQEIPVLAAKFAKPGDTGLPVDEDLASSTTYNISHPLEEKVLEETASKYPAPSNCVYLATPKVNGPIWDNLPQHTRGRDAKLQRVQKSLTKGLSALIQSFPSPRLTDTQQDALALLCNANFELNSLRKELMKPDMAATYSHLCKPSTPVTKFLFGDELGKRMKDLKEEQKAASGVMRNPISRPQSSTYYPYRGAAFSKPQYRSAGWTASSAASTHRPTAGGSSRSFLGQRPQWGHSKQPPPSTASRPPQQAPQHRPPMQRKK